MVVVMAVAAAVVAVVVSHINNFRMGKLWVQIENWYRANAPQVLESLQIGASDTEIAEAE